jgi:acyl-CoA reductase-like NAD-dependent aldehyde dehydrogenase
VVNILPAGADASAHLVSHPRVDKVFFRGSTAVGRTVAQTCGRLLRPSELFLDGKSTALVLDDADLDLLLTGDRGFAACLLGNGQSCVSASRVLAPRSRYAEVVDAFTELARSLPVGQALDPATRIGPLVSERLRDRLETYVAKARDEGARVTTGGGRPAGLERGWFYEPTVLAGVDGNAAIAQEVVHGPVLSVIAYGDEEEAVRVANDCDYGLAGSVWTSDPERGIRVARRIRTGTIGVNGYLPEPTAPFGGLQSSGTGRSLGPEGLAACLRTKSVYR